MRANIPMLAVALLAHWLPAAQAQDAVKGRAVYQAVCIACHAPENVMVSAPKAGDVKEWARRAGTDAAGLRQLTDHAVEGFGAMPPKGGRADLTRAQIQDAIEFMRQAPNKG